MVGLFIGVESYNWTIADFNKSASFCVQYGIDTVYLKIYEITQGEWYGGIGGVDKVMTVFEDQGIKVIPYGFFYGQSLSEVTVARKYLSIYKDFCMDMEGGFDNNPNNVVQAFSDGLKNHPGTLYVSTWANPVTHLWAPNIAILDDVVDVWMPQAYSDSLLKDMYAQFPKVKGKIEPTFHITDSYYLGASIYPNFSLWEYQIVQSNTTQLLYYIQENKGEKVPSYPTNNKGMVANYLPVSQFQPGYSEFECGAYAVALNQRATGPQTINTNSSDNLVSYAEQLYKLTTGSNGPSNSLGSSVDDMHTMLKNTQSYASPGLHWWDITSIGPSSQQTNDISQIKAALQHGYPVIATVTEQSVFDLDLQRNPYWWGASGNHILTWVGIAPDGNLLAVDPANVIQGDGNLQTPKTVQPWPRRYDITKIANQWATIVQLSWLPPIPNNVPVSWPAYQPPIQPPPQPTNQAVTVLYEPVSKELIFMSNNQAIYRITLS